VPRDQYHEQALVVPSKGVHVPALDGLRTLAIAAVMCTHLGILQGGNLGVTLFFVLSGFLIGSLLIGERVATGTIDLRAFYVRRAARLYPALIAALVIALPVNVIFAGASTTSMAIATTLALLYVGNLFSSLTGRWLPGINFTWTLAQEEQFYLLAPRLIRRANLARATRWVWMLVALAVLATGVRLLALLLAPDAWPAIYVNPLINADGMLIGLALAFGLAHHGPLQSRISWSASPVIPVVGLVAFAAVITCTRYDDLSISVGTPVAIGAAALMVCNICAAPAGWFARFLSLRPLRWVGERAYGLYLYHFTIFVLFGATQAEGTSEYVSRAAAAVITSLGVAWLSFRYLEQPAGRFIRRFQYRRKVESSRPN
jgi:peptidoglycan/LPS O-acetylase OafA/YrhL